MTLRVIPADMKMPIPKSQDSLLDEYDKRKLAMQEMCLTNEVKKVGILIDRGAPMEFRPNDMLIVYISMGGFER